MSWRRTRWGEPQRRGITEGDTGIGTTSGRNWNTDSFPFHFRTRSRSGLVGRSLALLARCFRVRDRPTSDDLVYAGGAGLRVLLFPDKDIYTRADFSPSQKKARVSICLSVRHFRNRFVCLGYTVTCFRI